MEEYLFKTNLSHNIVILNVSSKLKSPVIIVSNMFNVRERVNVNPHAGAYCITEVIANVLTDWRSLPVECYKIWNVIRFGML